jgi:nucleoside-diphosphate-sugar epimerase
MRGPIPQIPPHVVDVRDVAKAHVLAMDLPSNPGALERGYIIDGGTFSWREAVDHLRVSHPELKMPPTDQYPELPGPLLILDMSDTINDLKLDKYREPKQVR